MFNQYESKNFDMPLSIEKQNEYFKSFQQGDKRAGELLVKHNLRLVASVIKTL